MEAYEALGFVMEALSDDSAAVAHYKKAASCATPGRLSSRALM